MAFVLFYLAATSQRWPVWWATLLTGALLLFVAETLRMQFPARLGWREWDGGDGAFSTHLVLIAPLLLPLAWSEHDDRAPRLALFAVSLLLLFAAAWKTENRIVWPVLLVAFAAAALARRYARQAGPRLRGARYVAAAIVLLIVTLATMMSGFRAHVDSSVRAGGLVGIEGDLRPRVWSVAMGEIARAPWLGQGFGREIAAHAFKPLTPRTIEHPDILHAHNVFVDVALQLGIVGLAIFVVILLLLAREHARALRQRETCVYGILGFAILAGFVAKNLTDDFFYRHNGLVFWALMGAMLGLARRGARAP
jgi:O-antigen ligase